MAKIISKDEYDIRSIAYYQEEGGLYNEIITVLTKMRREPKFRGLPMPAKSLNEASYFYDLKKKNLSEENLKEYIDTLQKDLTKVLVALMTAAWEEYGFSVAYNRRKIIEESNPYLNSFDKVFEYYISHEEQVMDQCADQRQILDLQDEVKAKDSLLKDALAQIETLKTTVDSLKAKKESKIDKSLTFVSTLEYIKDQKQYQYCNQILEMLKDRCALVGAQEEYKLVMEVRQKMLDAGVININNHNNIQNSNVFPGMVNNPSFPVCGNPEDMIKKALDEYIKRQNDGQE